MLLSMLKDDEGSVGATAEVICPFLLANFVLQSFNHYSTLAKKNSVFYFVLSPLPGASVESSSLEKRQGV